MTSNIEFIRSRAFEIAWAVFRCASLVKRQTLKKELEDSAISLVSKFGDFSFHSQQLSLNNKAGVIAIQISINLQPIEKLDSIIKLAEAVGEIKIVNARVLHRELGNLSEAIRSAFKHFEDELNNMPNEDVFIEDIFSNNGTANQKNSGDEIKDGDQYKNDKKENEISEKKSSNGFPIVRQSREIKIGGSAMIKNSDAGSSASFGKNSAISSSDIINKPLAELVSAARNKISFENKPGSFAEQPGNDFAGISVSQEEDSIQDSWQNLIYRKIKEIGKTSTKEISAFFPEISERTVRFYLQKLTDSGIIEKIGTTGPGSFYKIR